jgi:Arc/MetJ-type ribon-helix-helix transcriptional regulator
MMARTALRNRVPAAILLSPWHGLLSSKRLVLTFTGRRSGTRGLQVARAPLQSAYDPGMSDRKARLTVTVDPRLAAYAEQLVATGKAPSVSAVFNDALSEKAQRERRALDRLKETAAQADRAKVARMIAHIDAQAAALPGK